MQSVEGCSCIFVAGKAVEAGATVAHAARVVGYQVNLVSEGLPSQGLGIYKQLDTGAARTAYPGVSTVE